MSRRLLLLVIVAFLAGTAIAWIMQRLEFTPPEDSTGQETPTRVICMAPSVAEIVFALGQGDRVVGVSQFTTYPPEALKKPVCGGFYNPSFEVMLSLRPDLVLTQGMAEKVGEFCLLRGIRHVRLETTDLSSVFSAIRQAGQVLECQAEAERLCSRMQAGLEEVRGRVKDKPRLSVFLVVGREPDSLKNLLTVGRDSFLNDVLEVAGGRNVFGDVSIAYPNVSKESLIERQPDVIIELRGEGMIGESEMERVVQTWRGMPTLTAVRSGRVYAIGNTYALVPGPRLVELARGLADILHGPAPQQAPPPGEQE